MKTLFLLLFLSATAPYCFAQNSQFKKGQVDVQAGIGFISPLFENTQGYLTTSFKVPPLSATAEYGITDEISVGGYVASALSTVHFNTGAQSYHMALIQICR